MVCIDCQNNLRSVQPYRCFTHLLPGNELYWNLVLQEACICLWCHGSWIISRRGTVFYTFQAVVISQAYRLTLGHIPNYGQPPHCREGVSVGNARGCLPNFRPAHLRQPYREITPPPFTEALVNHGILEPIQGITLLPHSPWRLPVLFRYILALHVSLGACSNSILSWNYLIPCPMTCGRSTDARLSQVCHSFSRIQWHVRDLGGISAGCMLYSLLDFSLTIS